MKKAVIVIPTYNERDNIGILIGAIQEIRESLLQTDLHILVVDDHSPDDTARVVQNIARQFHNVHLLEGKKQGLGAAYKRGMQYAIEELQAEVVFEMDGDLSHDPIHLPHFLHEIDNGNDVVIGSRYIQGGAVSDNWSWLRRLNSWSGNVLAGFSGIRGIRDKTSGYRAINADLLRQINPSRLSATGYVFQVELLRLAKKLNARITEIPITFHERAYGNSKLQLSDIMEFITHVVTYRVSDLKQIGILAFLVLLGIVSGLIAFDLLTPISLQKLITSIIFLASTFILVQSVIALSMMLYTWMDPNRLEKNHAPKKFTSPNHSFTALIPARHEEEVIAHTIEAVANIDYPESLKQILIICRSDDQGTIKEAQNAITHIGRENIQLVTFDGEPINKPHGLNIALNYAINDILVIFDAEDQPSPDIFHIVNTTMEHEHADVVQAGVQLIDYQSRWFSALNVLEYFFWFKSTLHFNNRLGVTPLGGNTVFFKRTLIEQIGGWDETNLTEDADIGINLSTLNAKISIIYDEQHATQEETPPSVEVFVKQRTRWSQGFLQVLHKGNWRNLDSLTKRLMALYILAWPNIQTLYFLYIPISILTMTTFKLPTWLAIYSILPLYTFLINFLVLNIGLYEFTREYKLPYSVFMPVKLLVTYFPYQLLLGFSALRASVRFFLGDFSWEKTVHTNAHRELVQSELATR